MESEGRVLDIVAFLFVPKGRPGVRVPFLPQLYAEVEVKYFEIVRPSVNQEVP